MSNIKRNGIKLSKLLQDKKGERVKEGRGVRVRKEDHSCAMAELSLRNLLNLYGKLLLVFGVGEITELPFRISNGNTECYGPKESYMKISRSMEKKN